MAIADDMYNTQVVQPQTQTPDINSPQGQQSSGMSMADRMYANIPTTTPSGYNTFIDGVTAFDNTFRQLPNGIIQMGGQIANNLRLTANTQTPGSFLNNLANDAQTWDVAGKQAEQNSPWAAGIGNTAATIGKGIYTVAGLEGAGAIPAYLGSKVGVTIPEMGLTTIPGNVVGRIAQSGVIGAAQGASDYANTSEDRAQKAEVYGTLGLLGGAGAAAFSNAASGVGRALGDEASPGMLSKVLTPATAGGQMLTTGYTNNPEGIQNAIQLMQQGQKIGVNVAPSQAFNSAPIKDIQDSAAGTGSVVANNTMQQNEQNGTQAIQGLIGKFTNGQDVQELTAAKNAAYANIENSSIGQDTVNALKTDPQTGSVISSRLAAITKNTDSPNAGLPDNSFAKLTELKQNIDSEMFNGVSVKNPDGSVTVQNLPDSVYNNLKAARNAVTSAMTSAEPDNYPQANKLAQQLILRNQYNDALTEINPKKTGPSVANGPNTTVNPPALSQSFTKLFGTSQKQDYYFDKLVQTSPNPEVAAANIEDAKQVLAPLNAVQTPVLNKLASTTSSGSGPKLKDGPVKYVGGKIEDWVNSRLNKAIINQTTDSSAFIPQAQKIAAQTGNNTSNTIGVFGRMANQYLGNSTTSLINKILDADQKNNQIQN